MKQIKIIFLITLFLLSCVLFLKPQLTFAQEKNSSSDSTKILNTNNLKGEILKITNDILTLKTDKNVVEVRIPQNIDIRRNTVQSKISDLKPGDKATLTLNANTQLLQIDATSGVIFDTSKWLIPSVVVVLILAILIWWLLNKGNKKFIKTTAE